MKLTTLIALLHTAHKIGCGRGRGIGGSAQYALEYANRESNAGQRGEDIGYLLSTFAQFNKDDSVIE
ncbi:hypothetical protein [Trinickia symbiotica]|nr:hypothetical protein [Trinickia symbiotica]